MNYVKNIIVAGAIALGVFGCGPNTNPPEEAYQIEAIPQSVEMIAYNSGGAMSIVIEEDGILTPFHSSGWMRTNHTDLAAMIQAEINDGDQETIILSGQRHSDDSISIDRVTVEGRTYDF